MCRLQGCRGEEGEEEEVGGGCIQNERHTLPDQRGDDSPFILQISSSRGAGFKVQEEAFKVDVSHISQSTKESQRSAIWTRHFICSGITKKKKSIHKLCPLFYPETTLLWFLIGCRRVVINTVSQLAR